MMKIPHFLCIAVGSIACASLTCVEIPPQVAELVEGHARFGFALHLALETSHPDLVFSPYSAASCLSMAYFGARGETASEMGKALHFSLERKTVPQTSFQLDQMLLPLGTTGISYEFKPAQGLFVDQGVFLLTDFRYAIEKQFRAHLGRLDFSNSKQALLTINDWVAARTSGKISELVAPADLDKSTKLMLLSAVYFKGNFALPFAQELTRAVPFYPTLDTSTTVQMMEGTETLSYSENSLIQMVALPFKGATQDGGKLAFVIVLPKSSDNLNTVTQELENGFTEWLTALKPEEVTVRLPKFTQKNRLDLKAALEQLGMEEAFGNDANFQGMDGMRTLMLGKVIHEALISVDEQGILASAATAAPMRLKGTPPEKPPILFTADHPFLYFIVDLKSREVLFMGQVKNP
jgi:serpin B